MAEKWEAVPFTINSTVIVDPYIEWALRTQFKWLQRGLLSNARISVILQLKKSAKAFATHWCPPNDPTSWREWLWVPPDYAVPPAGLAATTFCSATVTRQFFKELQTNSVLQNDVYRIGLGPPVIVKEDSKPTIAKEPDKKPGADAAPPVVLIGIIDDGLAFAHERFRGRDRKTRIEFFWHQDGLPGDPPPYETYGREISKKSNGPKLGIDDLVRAATYGGPADEDRVYNKTGLIGREFGIAGHKPLAWRAAHGTHVMDLACGSAPASAPDRMPIACVQLPIATTMDTSGATLGAHVLDAVRYIIRCAERVGKKPGQLPVVINLSYGTIAGPHDGTSPTELALDELIKERTQKEGVALEIVLPSGNSHLGRCHACFRLGQAGVTAKLRWRVQPQDLTPSYLEIWLPLKDSSGNSPKVKVRITAPGGVMSGSITEGGTWELPGSSQVLGKVVYPVPAVGLRPVVLVALEATTVLDAKLETAPSGIYEIEVETDGAAVGYEVHAWIQRDDTPYGYPRRGRQSRFEDANYARFDSAGRELETDGGASYIVRDGSINALATGKRTVVVGGMRRKDRVPAKYSAGGPVLTPADPSVPDRQGPDALAVSDDGLASNGVLAAGARSSSVFAMNGTSVAAPQITRWIAEQLALGNPGDRAGVHTEAAKRETPAQPGDPQPPARRGGAGRIELPSRANRGIEAK